MRPAVLAAAGAAGDRTREGALVCATVRSRRAVEPQHSTLRICWRCTEAQSSRAKQAKLRLLLVVLRAPLSRT